MSSLTTNLKLVKPELQDNITPTIFADNFDKIDAALEGVSGGALSLEEIEASTNLDGKIPSAAALKEVNNSLGGIKYLPDYANAVGISTTDFTAPSDGYLHLCGLVASNGGGYLVNVNSSSSTSEAVPFYSQTASNCYTELNIPMKKGNVAKITVNSMSNWQTHSRFIPFK